MSTIAVFLALGGSALAIKANSVGSRQIKDGSIKGRDVADGKLKGKNLKAGTIGSREIEEAAFDLEHFLKMGSTTTSCDPSSSVFVECGSVTLGTQESSKALLIGAGGQLGDTEAKGRCKFRINDAVEILGAAAPGFGDPAPRGPGLANGLALTAVSGLIDPGVNNFKLVCNETGGDVSFSTTFSVVAIGGTAG